MRRYFTLQDAQALLPSVERMLEAAVAARSSLAESEMEIAGLRQRVMTQGGLNPDPLRAMALKRSREKAAEVLKETVEGIHSLGVQIKDLDIGLIDFPTLYHGDEVLLCFRLGESGIGFWHGLNDGFQGRRAIDAEFLANHEGSEEE